MGTRESGKGSDADVNCVSNHRNGLSAKVSYCVFHTGDNAVLFGLTQIIRKMSIISNIAIGGFHLVGGH
jgi:hypothetical protein